eukprot:scaffold146662_cov28-Tisochrysis_lutea.AAC.3
MSTDREGSGPYRSHLTPTHRICPRRSNKNRLAHGAGRAVSEGDGLPGGMHPLSHDCLRASVQEGGAAPCTPWRWPHRHAA